MLLPRPFEKFIPRLYKRDAATLALAAKADAHLTQWEADITSLQYAIDPVRCPVNTLNEVGYLVSAGIAAGDTERQKRRKIRYAIQGHKNRGLWEADLKPKIDTITGRTGSRLIRLQGTDEWVMMAENVPADYYWAALGQDGLDGNLGPYPLGDLSLEMAGMILIDLIEEQTPEVITAIKTGISTEYLPAYFYVFLGYTTGVPSYTVHPNGRI